MNAILLERPLKYREIDTSLHRHNCSQKCNISINRRIYNIFTSFEIELSNCTRDFICPMRHARLLFSNTPSSTLFEILVCNITHRPGRLGGLCFVSGIIATMPHFTDDVQLRLSRLRPSLSVIITKLTFLCRCR